MEQLQQREWDELRSNTWQLLRRREHILRSKHRPVLQYLVIPSLTDTWCIDIVQTADILAAYHTVWRMTHDVSAFATCIERLKHPRPYIPTLASTPLDIPEDVIASLLTRVHAIQIPLLTTKNSISLDGVGYELQIGDGRIGVAINWHNQLPDEWPCELRDVVSDLNSWERQNSI